MNTPPRFGDLRDPRAATPSSVRYALLDAFPQIIGDAEVGIVSAGVAYIKVWLRPRTRFTLGFGARYLCRSWQDRIKMELPASTRIHFSIQREYRERAPGDAR